MSATLYLIEEWPVPEHLLQQWAHTEGAHIVSLNVQSAYGLSRRCIPFKRADEFYAPSAYEAVGERNFQRVKEFVQHVDGQLQTIDEIQLTSLSLAEANYPRLKVLFDSVALGAFELKNIVEIIKPSQIFFYGWPIKDCVDEIQFTNEETLYGRIILLLSQAYGISFTDLSQNSTQKVRRMGWKQLLVNRFKAYLPQLLLFKNVIRPILLSYISNLFKPRSVATPTFLLHSAYDVANVTQTMILKNMGPLFLLDVNSAEVSCTRFLPGWSHTTQKTLQRADIRRNLREIGERLLRSKEFLAYFEFEGINCADIIRHKLNCFFDEILPRNLHIYETCRALFDSHEGARLLMGNGDNSDWEMVLCAARQCGLRTYKYQHGSDGFFHFPLLEYYSLTNADGLFVFGEGVKQGLQKHFQRPIELLPVGSAALDYLIAHPTRNQGQRHLQRQGVDLNRPIVAYPLSVMAVNRMYISYHLYRDWAYYEIHRKVVDLFRLHPEVQLVIKTHPSPLCPESPVVQYIQDEHISNCYVIRTGAFTDLLAQANLFITDAPSTVALQAMTTTKKILIYNGILRFEPEARDLIKKRCLYHEDLDTFLVNLNQLLDQKSFVDVSDNREFLRTYGTHLDDGRSADRVIEELMHPSIRSNALFHGSLKSKPLDTNMLERAGARL